MTSLRVTETLLSRPGPGSGAACQGLISDTPLLQCNILVVVIVQYNIYFVDALFRQEKRYDPI